MKKGPSNRVKLFGKAITKKIKSFSLNFVLRKGMNIIDKIQVRKFFLDLQPNWWGLSGKQSADHLSTVIFLWLFCQNYYSYLVSASFLRLEIRGCFSRLCGVPFKNKNIFFWSNIVWAIVWWLERTMRIFQENKNLWSEVGGYFLSFYLEVEIQNQKSSLTILL